MNDKIKNTWQKIKPYFLPYSVAIAIPLTIGIISAALTRDNIGLYGELKTPPLSPTAILFPIIWTLLYILMGISSAIIYINRDKNADASKRGLKYYGLSLLLNLSWSIVFFNLQAAFFALIVLILLLFLIIRTIIEYHKASPLAAYLQIPYVLWVAFAGYLNAAIWIIN